MIVSSRIHDLAGRPAATARPIVRWSMTHALPGQLVRMGARGGDLQSRLVEQSRTGSTDSLSPLFEQIRAAGPLARAKFCSITVEHAAVREVLTSNDFVTGIAPSAGGLAAKLLAWSARDGQHPLSPPSLLVSEPPDHTRYRKLVSKVFTSRAVERLRGRTEQIASELLDQLRPGTNADLVQLYCAKLPVNVIAEILGVPPGDRDYVSRLGSAAAASLDMGLSWQQFRHVESALDDFGAWLQAHIERLRRNPGTDLLSELVAAREDGVGLSDRELRSIAGLVLAAGFETTVNLLGNAISALSVHPDQLALARARPQLWSGVVEEVLRADPPVLLTSRTATTNTTIVGQAVQKGTLVLTVLAGANRDPEVFADPNSFDITRANARDHLAFSAGRHYCLGAALARMEGEVGLRMLYERFGEVELLPGARRRSTRVLRGWAHLPARLNP